MSKHITRTVSNQAFWQINKHLHRILGLRTTLLLQHFIDLQTKVFKGEEFYQSYNQIQKELCLTEHAIKESIKKLNEEKVLSVIKKGMPAKNYYLVDLTRVEELLSLDLEKSPDKSEVVLSNENQLTSEVKTNPQVDKKSPDKLSENHLTNKRNNKKELKKEIKLKKESVYSNSNYSNNTVANNKPTPSFSEIFYSNPDIVSSKYVEKYINQK